MADNVKYCNKVLAARAAQLVLLIQQIILLTCDVAVAVAVVVFLKGSLTNDDSNGNENATNQLFDWLNEEK